MRSKTNMALTLLYTLCIRNEGWSQSTRRPQLGGYTATIMNGSLGFGIFVNLKKLLIYGENHDGSDSDHTVQLPLYIIFVISTVIFKAALYYPDDQADRKQ